MRNCFILSTDQLIDTFSRIASGNQFEFYLSNGDFNLEDSKMSDGDILVISSSDSVCYEFDVISVESKGVTLRKVFEVNGELDYQVDEAGTILPLSKEGLKLIHEQLFGSFYSPKTYLESPIPSTPDLAEEKLDTLSPEKIELKIAFSDWLFELGKYKRVYNNDKEHLLKRLDEFERAYEEDFGVGIFNYPYHSIDFIIEELESNIIGIDGQIGDLNRRIVGNGSVKAILGPNNYIKFLKEYKQNQGQRQPYISPISTSQKPFDIDKFIQACKEAGLIYSDKLIIRFISSLLAKPFVILTGLSGSGKTKLAQAFVQWICADYCQYRIIAVGADWTNREPILGYPNALDKNEYIKPDNGIVDLIIEANRNPDLPYFLILDEMNLSHVERYFADFLSAMESGDSIPLHDGQSPKNGVPSHVNLSKNIFIIGTVNIDETTNMFSPKVLDRANIIEFRISSEELSGFLNKSTALDMSKLVEKGVDMSIDFVKISNKQYINIREEQIVIESLIKFFGELQSAGAEFGYRSAMEIYRLISQMEVLKEDLSVEEKIDIAIMQKLLPKLHGSRRNLFEILEKLAGFCLVDSSMATELLSIKDSPHNSSEVVFRLSFGKIHRMYNRLIENGFTSYAEA